MANVNVLSERYATPEINDEFSEPGKIRAERKLWIAVMRGQRALGLDIPAEDIEKFERAVEDVDLGLIKEIEKRTKHDVKAKIEAFIKAAGAGQHLHKGMTSRDLTDNVEQMQYRNAAKIILGRNVSVLRHLLDNAQKYDEHVITARTHNQPAQPTLLGRRFSMWAEEMIPHLEAFEAFVDAYPLRGMKGAVGTQFDMLTLFRGDHQKVEQLERLVAESLGFKKVLDSTGQVYPRSLDSAMIGHLMHVAAAQENFALTMRLMAGFGLVNEGFEEGQSGSSVMAYKMNTRSCERVCGFANLLKMYADGASRISGDQWAEGDVSCSVPRRVIMPDAFYAADGMCETTLTVLNGMSAYEGEIVHELEKYLPFMATTEIMQKAVLAGAGREDIHRAIKRHAIAESHRMKREGSSTNRLVDLLIADPVFIQAGVTRKVIEDALQDKRHFVGNANEQIQRVYEKGQGLISRYEQEARYEPRPIL